MKKEPNMLSFTQFITEEVSTGININDKTQPFTDQILHGQKTIETRNTPTLHPHVGKRVGIVRTGKGPAGPAAPAGRMRGRRGRNA